MNREEHLRHARSTGAVFMALFGLCALAASVAAVTTESTWVALVALFAVAVALYLASTAAGMAVDAHERLLDLARDEEARRHGHHHNHDRP